MPKLIRQQSNVAAYVTLGNAGTLAKLSRNKLIEILDLIQISSSGELNFSR